MALQVRMLSDEEVETIHRLAHSRTEPARAVERARIVWFAHQGLRVPSIARELRRSPATVRSWLIRMRTAP